MTVGTPVRSEPASLTGQATGAVAFAVLYERHAQGIFDFAARMLGDRDAAADVAQTAFARAWKALDEGRSIDNVKAWLYAVAHNSAIDELRHRKRRPVAGPDDLAFAVVDTDRAIDPEDSLRDRQLAELVWECAAALPAKDYALLDLHVRRGLDADELADSLCLQRGAVSTRLSRLRGTFERSVATTLLVRWRGCPELDRLLAAGPPDAHGAVQRHAEGCERCREAQARFHLPSELLATLAPVPLGAELHGSIYREACRPQRRGRRGWLFLAGGVFLALTS